MNATAETMLRGFVGILPFLLTFGILTWAYRFFDDLRTTFDDRESMKAGISSVGLSRSGGYLGIGLAAMGSLLTKDADYWSELGMFALDGVIAIGVFLIASAAIDWVVLPGIENDEHIAADNKAVAMVDFFAQTSLGLIMLGSFAGGGQGLWAGMGSAVLFSFLALAILVAIYKAYQLWCKLARYDVDSNIANGKVVAAVDVGMVMLGVAFTLMFSIIGEFEGWWNDIASFGIAAGSSLLAVAVGRLIGLFLARGRTYRGNMARSLVVGVMGVGAGILAGLITFFG